MHTTTITVPMNTAITTDQAGLARRRLWQLLSPTLPIGAYSYSGGLEAAVEAGWIPSADAVRDWLEGQLRHTLSRVDVPLLARLHEAWLVDDTGAVMRYSAWLRASRETAELAAEDHHLGRALATLLADLGLEDAEPWRNERLAAWAPLFALALARWQIPLREGAEAYLWSWCDNQVAAAVKLVPLGQTAGQRLLQDLAGPVGTAADVGLALEDEAIGGSAPGLAIASSLHETQYSRLFRS
ncbi:urease accessory protein [Natronocella acetinitrilica]|jgi:urease accessory protein|uniref:Urease accessory protein UreF n=1 Tax=Natronocella acetinitrilica TaxID=414046 RepID=A0AAE3G854_9GAMM|nr:urease accessory UreF family protein [Natronocella acetinitrilica]MCP1676784.1 urease accessory protein [Natronocella acetinitrilica]